MSDNYDDVMDFSDSDENETDRELEEELSFEIGDEKFLETQPLLSESFVNVDEESSKNDSPKIDALKKIIEEANGINENKMTENINNVATETKIKEEDDSDVLQEDPDINNFHKQNTETVQQNLQSKNTQPENDDNISDEKLNNTPPANRNLGKSTKENKARFLNRKRITYVICIFIMLIYVFFSFILPNIGTEAEKANELDKASSIYIPNYLSPKREKVIPTAGEDNPFLENSFEEPSISFFEEIPQQTEEDLEKSIDAKMQIEEPPTQQNTNVTSTRPQTWANEQQKTMQRLSLGSTASNNNAQNFVDKMMNGGSSYDGYGNQSNYANNPYGNNSTLPRPQISQMSTQMGQLSSMNFMQQGNSQYSNQNMQSDKMQFMNNGAGTGGNLKWNSEYALFKGTYIPAVLETAINTDLPGVVIASVTTNVYSSLDGRYILIPQGSKLYAEYNSSISYNQNRVQVAWNTLIRPDGLEINLGNMQGIDSQGMSGYSGFTNYHPFEYAKALGLIGMFSIIDTKMHKTLEAEKNQYAQNALSNVYSSSQQITNKILDKAMDVQPTITIKSGTEILLITNVTMDIPPIEPFAITEKYTRY